MAVYPIQVDLQLNKQSILGAKIYPLTTSNRTALSLLAGDEGILVYDTTLDKLMAWNGTAWVDATPMPTGGMVFRGGIAANAVAPASPVNGDLYVFTTSGTTPVSWVPTAIVSAGDQVLWDNANSVWRYIEGNAVAASTSVAGLIALATQGEVDTGSVSDKAITPATLGGFAPSNALALRPVRRSTTNIASLVADTATTVTHNLALANAADLVVNTWQGGSQVLLAIAPVNANSLTVTSNVTLSNVRVVCEG